MADPDRKHTFKFGDLIESRCKNCGYNYAELIKLYGKGGDPGIYEHTIAYANEHMPCLTEEELQIRDIIL